MGALNHIGRSLFKIGIVFSILSIAGCNKNGLENDLIGDKSVYVYSDSAIPQYCKVHSLDARARKDSVIVLEVINGNTDCSMQSIGEDLKRYQALCDKYGDHGFNHNFLQIPAGGFDNFALINQVVGIEIRSTSHLDEQHLAGTLLNDCFMCHYFNNKAFISNGYKNIPQEDKELKEMGPADFDLSFAFLEGNAQSEEGTLSYPVMFLALKPNAYYPGLHLFQITVTFDNGKQLDTSVTLDI